MPTNCQQAASENFNWEGFLEEVTGRAYATLKLLYHPLENTMSGVQVE